MVISYCSIIKQDLFADKTVSMQRLQGREYYCLLTLAIQIN